MRPETAVPLNVALVEGNETLHTSHLQCHIFVPLLSLPSSLPQHTTIYKGKRLLPVLHPSRFVFFSVARPVVLPSRDPLPLQCPLPPTPHPFRFCISAHMASSTNHIAPIPTAISLKKRQTTYSLYRIIPSSLSLLDLKLMTSLCIFLLGFGNLIIRCTTGCTNLAFQQRVWTNVSLITPATRPNQQDLTCKEATNV